MKRKTFTLVSISLFLAIFLSCEKDDTILPADEMRNENKMISQSDVADNSADDLNLYIKSLEEQGYSDDEIEKMLVKYLSTQQNSKAVKYTYSVSGVTIGCWMLKSCSTTDRADWRGKLPYEPITNMWKDKVSTSSTLAFLKVSQHLVKRGYDASFIHSYSYYGHINGTCKYNATGSTTYSDNSFYKDNNHGRIFGPVKVGDYWITIGAFSRESGTSHNFINFYQARDKAAGTSTFFPNKAVSKASGNTWADGYSTIKVLIVN
ncbi:MAG: hypothetical protein PHE03_02855 [Bacteroidales bacterium]|nr:hypothetical protein [Bacteroidales bacterium]MDD3891217.1 hypothetical protein [Bacteroidales bacterium]MDY0143236.1 hypothetical protein [Bacteroidales bacterium]